MSRLILDIETVGKDMETLDEASRNYFLRFADTEEGKREAEESLSFYPLTGEIVAIGLLNPDTGKGAVYYQAPGHGAPSHGAPGGAVPGGEPLLPFEEGGISYETGTEKDILNAFWKTVKSYKYLITFNGRGFDCPFIMVRSAMHKIKPTKDLMPNRYADTHIDLMDRLTFFGATRKRFSLDMWCRAFGIKSPKTEVTGYEVKGLFKQGRYMDIARYCAEDLRATRELLDYWENYIK